MRRRNEPKAPKRTTTLSLNAFRRAQARERVINLDATLERARVETPSQRTAWLEANREAIQAYNARIDGHGVFSDGLRRF